MLNDNVREFIAQAIAGSPHARFEGFRLDEVAPDRAVLRLPHASHNMNGSGRINGGVTLALIDTAATCAAWACNRVVPGETRGTTVAVSTNFLAPGGATDLLAESRVLRRGGNLTIVQVTVRDGEGEIATALVTYRLGLKPGD